MKALKFNFKNILTITKNELRGFLDNPASYVVFVVFMLLWNFLSFRSVFIVGESSLNLWFNLLPWLLLVFVSAVTMASVSKEKEDGTLELVLTHPVTEADLVLGKFLGATVYIFSAVLFTLPVAFLFSKYGSFDWGIYFGQLMGSLFLIMSLVALGVFVSVMFASQIASLLVTIAASFAFIVFGTEMVTISLPLLIGNILEKLSLFTHYTSVSRGVLDIVDVLYFALFISTFLILSKLQLLKQKFGNNKIKYTGVQTAVMILVGAVFVISMINTNTLLRLDVTQGRIYTLSDSTKKVLRDLQEPVNITLYVSEQLPSQYSPVLRELQYVLQDYKSVAGDKLVLETKDPSKDSAIEQQALTEGVQKVQFNVIGKEELQLKTGYLGFVVKKGDSVEPVAFVQSTDDLEYELTSLIKKVTTSEKKTVGFLAGHGEKSAFSDLTILNQELSKIFNTSLVTISKETPKIDDKVNALVVIGGESDLTAEDITAIKEFISKGKNVVFMYDSYTVNNTLGIVPTPGSVSNLLKEVYGVSINNDLVYDLNLNELISLQSAGQSYTLPYPLWIRSLVNAENLPFRTRLQDIAIPWVSSLSYDTGLVLGKYNYKNILVTTPYGGKIDNPANIDPNQQFSQQGLGEKVVGVLVEPITSDQNMASGKAIIVGDSDFVVDAFLQRSPQNLAFGLDLITWSAGEDTLSDIQVKSNVFGRFQFSSEVEATNVKYTVMGIAILVPLLVGFARYVRRRTLRLKVYEG